MQLVYCDSQRTAAFGLIKSGYKQCPKKCPKKEVNRPCWSYFKADRIGRGFLKSDRVSYKVDKEI